MRARERIIRERFTEQACAHCQAHYAEDSVVVLAHRRSVWMVMASCPQCERRALFVVSFPDVASHAASTLSDIPDVFPNSYLTPDPDDPPSKPLAPLPEVRSSMDGASHSTPVSADDVNAMHDFLRRFDGDFRALFTPHPPRRDDASS